LSDGFLVKREFIVCMLLKQHESGVWSVVD